MEKVAKAEKLESRQKSNKIKNMRKLFFLISLVVLFSLSVFSQNNPLTTGSNNVSVEKIQLTNKTDEYRVLYLKKNVYICLS